VLILGASANEKVQLVTDANASIRVHVSYIKTDLSTPPVVQTIDSDYIAAIATATTTDILAGAANRSTRVGVMSARNEHASQSCTCKFQVVDGTNTETLIASVLAAGETMLWTGTEWRYYDSGGKLKTTPGAGCYLGSTLLTAASGTFTTSSSTRTIKIRGVGGGGGGAGCTSVASAASAGGGGASGSYAEKTFSVSPSTGYAYVCGAAGNGVSASAGNTGGNSTFTVGATTVTAPGGAGAVVATAVAALTAYKGGAPGAASTNGDVNTAGDPGGDGVIVVVATPVGASGEGGSSPLGGGGAPISAVGNGNNATGFGAGGGGAMTGASAARTGGNGTAGCWVVDEFS